MNFYQNRCKRCGFTLIELLVVLSIIGMLTALALPSVQRARAAAWRTRCESNLHQVAIAVQQFCDSNDGQFPPGSTTPWTVDAAPYLEQQPLYDAYDHQYDPYSWPANSQLGDYEIPSFFCPADDRLRVAPRNWLSANVAGNLEVLQPQSTRAQCTDGDSNTGLAIEIASDRGLTVLEGPRLFLGWSPTAHQNACHLLMVGGSVLTITDSIDPKVMQAINTPNGGEVELLP